MMIWGGASCQPLHRHTHLYRPAAHTDSLRVFGDQLNLAAAWNFVYILRGIPLVFSSGLAARLAAVEAMWCGDCIFIKICAHLASEQPEPAPGMEPQLESPTYNLQQPLTLADD